MTQLKIFGDSILKGVKYNAESRKYELYRADRFSPLTERGFSVENRSRMGATVKKGMRTVTNQMESMGPGSIALLEYGGNDSDYDWAEISADPKGEFLPHTPEKDFIAEYGQMITMLKKQGVRVVLSTLVPIDAPRYFAFISRNLSQNNILHWLGDTGMLYRWQEYYNRLVEGIAERFGCELLDLRRAFLTDHRYESLLCADGIHPTDRGHSLISSHICRYF